MKKRIGKRLALALEQRRFLSQQLRRELHPRRLADCAIIESPPEYKNIGAVEHMASRILEVFTSGIEHGDVQGRSYKLQERIAF